MKMFSFLLVLVSMNNQIIDGHFVLLDEIDDFTAVNDHLGQMLLRDSVEKRTAASGAT